MIKIRALFFLLFLLFGWVDCSLFAESAPSSVETGYASWYGGKFQGRPTASGEIFDTHLMTAAHKSLPFNTMIKVVNLKNQRSALVRINDRGPFIEGRIIDLSLAAAKTLDMVEEGVTLVKLLILKPTSFLEEAFLKTLKSFHPSYPAAGDREKRRVKTYFVIQIGAYRNRHNALVMRQNLNESGFAAKTEDADNGIVRVVIPNLEEEEADKTLNRLQEAGYFDAFKRRSKNQN